MSMDQVSKLTMRQVVVIYFRERDKKTGVPKVINPTWDDNFDEVDDAKAQFIAIQSFFGKSLPEIEAEWEAMNNGNTSE